MNKFTKFLTAKFPSFGGVRGGLLAGLFILCLLPFAANAQVTTIDSGTCGTSLTWKLTSDSTLTISGSGDMDDYVYIPSTSTSAPWRFYRNYINAVIIDSGVTTIGDMAFGLCENLTSVIIGNSVISIGVSAFGACYRLTSVIIPNSVLVIKDDAFYNCESLTSITIPNSVIYMGYTVFTCFGGMPRNYYTNLKTIICEATIPPIIFQGTFYAVPDTIPIYVPCNSLNAYQTANHWSRFTNFIGRVFDTTFIFDTVCKNERYYNGNGFTVSNGAGVYHRTEATTTNCGDSLICLILSEYDTIPITNYSAYFCYGKTYSDSNFTNLKQDGLYYKTLQNSNGCDSIICLKLGYYTSTPATYYSDTICQGEYYTDDNFTNLTKAGFHYNYLKNRFGCDSTIILELIVLSVPITQLFDSIRQGDTCNFNGELLTLDGIYYDTLQTIHGCDSIIRLTLKITNLGTTNYELRNTNYVIYPNPTTGQLRITNYELRENTVIEIFDIYGKKHPSPFTFRYPHIEIDISHLASGIYFFKINNKIIKIMKY